MFDHKPTDMTVTLSQMEHLSRDRSNFNQTVAQQKLAQFISQDRRFDGYDPAKLAERVQKCRSNGAVIDLNDPVLKHGGQKRPLDRSGW